MRQEDRTKRQAVASGLAFAGKGKELDKMLPGRKKRRGADGVSALEELGVAGALPPHPADPADEDDWLAQTMSHFRPAD